MSTSKQTNLPPGLANLAKAVKCFLRVKDQDKKRVVEAFIYGRYNMVDISRVNASAGAEVTRVLSAQGEDTQGLKQTAAAGAAVYVRKALADVAFQLDEVTRTEDTRKLNKLLEMLGLTFLCDQTL